MTNTPVTNSMSGSIAHILPVIRSLSNSTNTLFKETSVSALFISLFDNRESSHTVFPLLLCTVFRPQ